MMNSGFLYIRHQRRATKRNIIVKIQKAYPQQFNNNEQSRFNQDNTYILNAPHHAMSL